MDGIEVGDIVADRFEVVRDLGGGGMGRVVLVWDRVAEQEVALKYCTETDITSLRRFKREVRIMQRIDHVHIMPVLGEFLESTPPFFTMPLAEHSLDEEIHSLSKNEDAALEAAIQICLGVEALHASGGTHRDLKPYNALRMLDGRVVVSDFGLAKLDPRDTTVLTQTRTVLGTAAYLAPEQRNPGGSRDAGPQTDVFQLGATFYHMLTGSLPLPVDPDRLGAGVRPAIMRATQPVAARRYSTVGELRAELEERLQLLRVPDGPEVLFEATLARVISLLEGHNKYNRKDLSALLRLIVGFADDASEFLARFDRIPVRLLKVIAQKLPPEEVAGVAQCYCRALDVAVGSRPWSYAETVADTVVESFYQTATPELTALAVRACLIAAVDLNRFAAMEAFDTMLDGIKGDDEAGAVAQALREERRRYAGMAGRLEPKQLHPILRGAQRDAKADPVA